MSSGNRFLLAFPFDVQPCVAVSARTESPWCVFQKTVCIGQIAVHVALLLSAQAGIYPFQRRRCAIVSSSWKMVRFTTLLERHKIVAVKSRIPQSIHSKSINSLVKMPVSSERCTRELQIPELFRRLVH